jgi:N-acetylglutamate synthase-like GNAT family acetyltransferase
MEIRTATQADYRFVKDLQNKHRNEIGFIPPGATQREIEWGHVLFAEENADDAGFLLVQPALGGQRTTAAIIQAAVRMDARRMKIGLALVAAIAAKAKAAGSTILQCWCRTDLDANAFWNAAGFQHIATRNGGTIKNIPCRLWRLPLDIPADALSILPDNGRNGPGGRFQQRVERLPLFDAQT